MKNLEKGKYYFLKVNQFGRELEYEGEVTALEDGEFVLKTPEVCRLKFRIKDLVFVKEKKAPEKKDPHIVVRKRVGPEGLKEPDKPKGL
jgi:hypothetical protein